MKRWPYFILAGLILLTSESIRAQEISFSHLTTEDGLSHNDVWCILRDDKGFVWFGTAYGLNRYDGNSFNSYFNHPSDTSSISANSITCLYQDSKKRIWIGTKIGLNLYDPAQDNFINFFSDLGNRNNHIKAICEDGKGSIWVGTSSGIKRIDLKDKKLLPFIPEGNDPYNLLKSSIRNIIFDSTVWIAYDSGIVSYDQEKKIFRRFSPEPRSRMLSIFSERNNFWIGTFENGLFQFNRKSKVFKNFQHIDGDNNSIIGNEVTKCLRIEGKLWICTPLGLSVMDTEKLRFNNFLHNKLDGSSLSSSSVIDISEDIQGIVWIASRLGVNIYSPAAFKFNLFNHKITCSNCLSENTVCGITENKKGEIIIATDGGGVNFFHPSQKTFSFLLHNENNPNSISNDKTLAVLEDSFGGLYVGTWEGGLNYVDPKTNHVTHYFKDPLRKALTSNNIFYLFEDKDGEIWVCTWGGGVCRMDAATKKINALTASGYNSSDLETAAVVFATQDSHGTLWFGTQERGVFSYDKKKNIVTRYTYDRNNPGTISVNNANVIFEDSRKRLWFGTEGGGLNLFHRNTNSFSHFRMRDGLSADAIAGILEDDHGNLWISSSNGISKTKVVEAGNTVKFESKFFHREDGLQDRQFNRWAFFKSKNGHMYFGGPNGFNSFHPDSLDENQFNPSVVITGFYIANKKVAIGPDSPLKENISITTELKLNYNQSAIAFDFIALNLIHPQMNQYAYMLENFDEEWNYIGHQRKAVYTNLDPGNYIFKVKATNNDDRWSARVASINITILPPWWKTLVFRVSVVLFLLLFVYLIYKLRIRYLVEQKIALAKLVKERTTEIEERNGQLIEKISELADKSLEIHSQNEELKTQRDQISTQRAELEQAQSKLKHINERLELLVSHRTKRLRQTIKTLDKTVMELDHFVYSASHDLIAPLKSIRGLINIGKLDSDNKHVSEYYNYIEVSIDKLERVIRSMVDFSRNANLEITTEPINAHNLVNDVIKTLTYGTERHITFNNKIPEDAVILVDPQRLKIIIQNMVSNGIKYADYEKENPYISFEYSADDDNVYITIADNGIGIPKENIDKIFNMYYRGTTKSDGSGLGLFIVKETLARMQGEVAVKSVPNKETAFTIRFKKKKA